MLQGRRIAVVLPAYNAAATLERTYREIPRDLVDEVLLVDDASEDRTVSIAKRLGVPTFTHPTNRGYGGNQKTCYRQALKLKADVFIMLHPDYQYTPKLIPAMASMVVSGEYDMVLGSRILGGQVLKGGMPLYKYISNRFLTWVENMLTLAKLSEYHTGYRAFSRQVLETLPLEENSNDFVFDNQIIVQALYFGFRIGEISCPTHYFPDASIINFARSTRYGLGVLVTALQFRIQKLGIFRFAIFDPNGRRLGRADE
ncbi:glycosyltransferase family 2 protein [Acidobacteria bacterium AH-259-D05]|nr:glycosyltransferase family 2 protein [Acidobacteria bacterium AH-259-D05]